MKYVVTVAFDDQEPGEVVIQRKLKETFNMNCGVLWSPVGDAIEEKRKPIKALTSGSGFVLEQVVAAERVFKELRSLRQEALTRWTKESDANAHKCNFIGMHQQQMKNIAECLHILEVIRLDLVMKPLRLAA